MEHRIRRALVSVFDKEGVVELCKALASNDAEVLSSGGTARLLEEHGVPVTRVADYTGFPEMLDGRVKTLHPRIHGGILAVRANAGHMADLDGQGIKPIDLVVVNLYPFEKTATTEGISVADVIEMIDIGGPAMVRSAAKNHAYVGVVVDPADYPELIDELKRSGGLSDERRLALAIKAFRHTGSYDNAVQAYLSGVGSAGAARRETTELGEILTVDLVKAQDLRYGENPHQSAAFYREPLAVGGSISAAQQFQGKELSFNNILDLDAALGVATEFDECACAIIKHGNPCGVALGTEGRSAYEKALACDPMSAFGGVVAFNTAVDALTAQAMAEHFFEAIIAPAFDADARAALKRKKKLRLLELSDLPTFRRGGFDLRRVSGGMLVQNWDEIVEKVRESEVVTRREPTREEWLALEFGWKVAKNVKSNAIVYTFADRTVGIGAGQMSRVDSARIGVEKAQSPLAGCSMASDAFFPFRDGIDAAAEAGVKAVIQPGGSIRDAEVIAAADEHGMAMVFTGRRHFRH